MGSSTTISADPCLALAQAGRRPGSPQVCGFGLLGPRPAWSTRHQTLCHCLPKSPRTRCPAAAVLCQRLASRHTPFRGFQNVREARPITTQNHSVGLYRFATAFPGHLEHVALQRHHDTKPVCGPLPLCHCLPRSPQTRCPAAAVLCQRLASRHTPLRGFQNVREARPITTQNPSVGLYRFATAFPGHRKHVGLQRQSFASAWPVAILHSEGFKTCAKHGPSRHKTPLWAFTALPLPSQVTANTLPCSGSPLPAPGHVAILHLDAWPVAILHLEGFKTCAKHGPSRHKTPLWAFTALPLPSQVTANTLPCSGSPLPAPGLSPYSI